MTKETLVFCRVRAHLHLGDVLVERNEVLPVVLGEETAQPRQLILHVLVLHHSHLEVLAEVLPWWTQRAARSASHTHKEESNKVNFLCVGVCGYHFLVGTDHWARFLDGVNSPTHLPSWTKQSPQCVPETTLQQCRKHVARAWPTRYSPNLLTNT